MKLTTWRSPDLTPPKQCFAVEQAISTLKAFIETLDVDPRAPRSASEKFRSPLLAWAHAEGWLIGVTTNEKRIKSLSDANYKINALLDLPSGKCGHSHRVFLHAFFDNRQAIGTNLLRLETSVRAYEVSPNRIGHAIGLCLDAEIKAKYKWDSSVATEKEYEMAIYGPYREIFQKSFELWTLRLA